MLAGRNELISGDKASETTPMLAKENELYYHEALKIQGIIL
jgi:hypothetical protein